MKTALIALALGLGLMIAPLGLKFATKASGPKTSTETVAASTQVAVPVSSDSLEESAPIKDNAPAKTITLEAGTTIVLRGPVTGSSVGKAMRELRDASRRVPKTTPLYLVLDTPGGSIMDGNDLIDFAKALPQKVHTVTLFAASMGFQIAQNLDTRYIVTNGTLMSHRASINGLGGQVKGELETRYRMIRRTVDYLDFVASKRMGIDLKTYENKILNEYWVYGFDALEAKVADEQVMLRCGESLDGSDSMVFDTLFGPVTVTFSKCPLMKDPESINLGKVSEEHREEVSRTVKMSLSDKVKFVNEFIVTSRFSEIFR